MKVLNVKVYLCTYHLVPVRNQKAGINICASLQSVLNVVVWWLACWLWNSVRKMYVQELNMAHCFFICPPLAGEQIPSLKFCQRFPFIPVGDSSFCTSRLRWAVLNSVPGTIVFLKLFEHVERWSPGFRSDVTWSRELYQSQISLTRIKHWVVVVKYGEVAPEIQTDGHWRGWSSLINVHSNALATKQL